MPAKKRPQAKKTRRKVTKKDKTLKRADIHVRASILPPPSKHSDKTDGTDKKTDPKVGKNPHSDFRDHGDQKR
jgi:hypothetical protein